VSTFTRHHLALASFSLPVGSEPTGYRSCHPESLQIPKVKRLAAVHLTF
jgi:hypothetical protein